MRTNRFLRVTGLAAPLLLTAIPSAAIDLRAFETPQVNGPIHAVERHGNALVVAGHFDHVGTQVIANVAKWDGSSWTGLDPIVSEEEYVYSLCVWNEQLVAGVTCPTRLDGSDFPSKVEIHSVHRWTPTGWEQMGEPLLESPRALAVHEGQLFVGLRTAFTTRGQSHILWAAPNPFNPSVTLTYTMAHAGVATLEIYDVGGRRVAAFERRHARAGEQRFTWNGRDGAGQPVASGVYSVMLRAADGHDVERVTLLK